MVNSKKLLPQKKINVLGDAAPATNSAQTTTATAANGSQATSTQIVTKTNPWLWASTILFALIALVLSVYVFHLKARLKQLHIEQEKVDAITSENEKLS